MRVWGLGMQGSGFKWLGFRVFRVSFDKVCGGPMV